MRKILRILPKIGHLLWWGCGFLREELEAILFYKNCSVPIVLDAERCSQKFFLEIPGKKKFCSHRILENFSDYLGNCWARIGREYGKKKITVLKRRWLMLLRIPKTEEIHGGMFCKWQSEEREMPWEFVVILAHGLTVWNRMFSTLHWGKAGEELQKDWRVFSAEELITFFSKAIDLRFNRILSPCL